MRTRVGLFCDKVIEAGWLVALVVVPLFFNIYSQRVFEPDKLSILRSITLVMAVAWLVRVVEDARFSKRWRSDASRSGNGPAWTWRRLADTPLVLPTLLLVLVYIVSTLLSVSPAVSFLGSYQRLQGTYTTLSYVVVFFLVLDGLRTRRQLERLITVAIVVSFPIAAYGLVQHFDLDPLPWGGNVTTRVASNMGNAIFVAAYLIMVVPLTLSRLMTNWRQATGEVDLRDGLLGVVSAVLLALATTALVMLRRGVAEVWLCWLGIALGVLLQVPIFLLSSDKQRRKILAISLPLVFAFVVGLAWLFEVVLETIGPPVGDEEAGLFFQIGALFALVFALAMASFSYFLRKPLSRLLLLAAYFVILIAQLSAIVYTQSRGPLLGLLAGLFAFLALLGLVRRQVWLTWLTATLVAGALVFLVLFNTVESPWLNRLREVPIVGRLGKVLQTEEGTGKVRVLIWEGAAEMITWHAPLDFPGEDGGPDTYNALRPIIGYGPESMYVAYNRFYPPELAHYEKRNASPDRSHNETFDALVTTGAVGFLVYMFVFSSVFYYGLKWLAVIREKWEKLTFLGLWIGGGLGGAIAGWAWGGPVYVGVGIPGGMIVGLALTLAVVAAQRTAKPQGPEVASQSWVQREERVAGRYTIWIVALFAAVLAHFVEIHFGIGIAATRTYFWVYVAALVAIGIRLRAQPGEETRESSEGPKDAGSSAPSADRSQQDRPTRVRGRRRRRSTAEGSLLRATSRVKRSEQGRDQPRRSPNGQDWRGSLVVWCLVTILVLSTMLFNSITIQRSKPLPEYLREEGTEVDIARWREDNPAGLWGNIWYSLTVKDEIRTPVMMLLLLATWGMLCLVLLCESRNSHSPAAGDEFGDWGPAAWLAAAGTFGAATLVGALLFALVHASQLVVLRLPLEDLLDPSTPLANPLARTFTTYNLFLLLIVVGMATALTFLFRRRVARPAARRITPGSRQSSDSWERAADLVPLGMAIVASALAAWLIYASNISIVRADIYYKQGLSYENVEQWDAAVRYYQEAINIAPNQDFYYLFLGRAQMEKAKDLDGDERDRGFERSGEALLTARRIAPLNTDHSANLARLYRTWGGLSGGDEGAALLDKALAYYVDANSLSPNNAQILNEWGQTYLAMGDEETGLEKYNESLALDPEFGDTYVRLGEFYTLQEDWKQAQAAYELAVEFKPKSAQAYSSLGYTSSKLGDREAALKAYQKAVELRPKNYNHRRNLAVIYRELGRTEDAIREGLEALELAPADQKQMMRNFLAELGVEGIGLSTEEAQLVQQLLADGRTQLEAKEWAAAEPYYLQALELDPDNAQAHMELAYAYAQMGRVDEAIQENQTVASLQPLDYGSHMNLAILYQQKGDYARAIEENKQALDLAPEAEKLNLHLNLALLYQQTGDYSLAIEETEQALPLASDDQKAEVEAYLEQLRALLAAPPTSTPRPAPTGPVSRAGDLEPEQREGMYGEPPAMSIDPTGPYRATIVTAKGNIVVELAAADAPQTVNNFVYLARQGFYDGLSFHRVEDSLLIQGGDPLGSGTGGPGYRVPAEIGLPHDEGAIAMARLGDQVNPERASSGSQFYICLAPIHQLDGGYTVFGYVLEGLDVAKQIAAGDQMLTIVITEE